MVSAVLSHDEIKTQERRSQRRFGFSLLTAVALHLALFAGFINVSFNAEPAQIMMPASQLISATLVMAPAPKPVAQSKPEQAPQVVQKAKPVQPKAPKPQAKKLTREMPKPVPAVQPVVETVQESVEIQEQPASSTVVDDVLEAALPRDLSIVEESYRPPSSNVAYYQNPKPRYPSAAKRRGMEGMVELRVMVDSNGQPVAIEVKQSSGFDVLDREAIKAVWRWRFQPATRAGMAVSGEVIVPVRYQLDSA